MSQPLLHSALLNRKHHGVEPKADVNRHKKNLRRINEPYHMAHMMFPISYDPLCEPYDMVM